MARPDEPRRQTLLSQAVSSIRLSSTGLWALGPNRSVDEPPDGVSNIEVREVHNLEAKLHMEIQSLLEARNHVLAPVFRLTDDLIRMIFMQLDEDRRRSPPEWRLPYGLTRNSRSSRDRAS